MHSACKRMEREIDKTDRRTHAHAKREWRTYTQRTPNGSQRSSYDAEDADNAEWHQETLHIDKNVGKQLSGEEDIHVPTVEGKGTKVMFFFFTKI